MLDAIRVLGISGSLRKGSYNTACLRAAGELMPEGMLLDIYDLSPIPLYNGDVEAKGTPEPVRHFREHIKAADAILFATPEYDYSIPGVLKNAIDWASRPAGQSAFKKKPGAIIGASTGNFGTVRAQLHLRTVLTYNDMYIVNQPEVLIMRALDKFDAQGRLTDDMGRDLIRKLLVALADLTRKVSAPVAARV